VTQIYILDECPTLIFYTILNILSLNNVIYFLKYIIYSLTVRAQFDFNVLNTLSVLK
jgi:tellurite resistance protein TehA-like permease